MPRPRTEMVQRPGCCGYPQELAAWRSCCAPPLAGHPEVGTGLGLAPGHRARPVRCAANVCGACTRGRRGRQLATARARPTVPSGTLLQHTCAPDWMCLVLCSRSATRTLSAGVGFHGGRWGSSGRPGRQGYPETGAWRRRRRGRPLQALYRRHRRRRSPERLR